MTTITPMFFINKVYVQQYPDCPDAIARVTWTCEMARNEVKIYGAGVTYLVPPSPQGFIPIAQLTAQQVVDWIIQTEGGQPWVDSYLSLHEPQMARAERNAEMQYWPTPLTDQPPVPIPTPPPF